VQAIKAIPPWTGYNQPDLANQSTTRTSPKLVVNYSVSVMKAPVSLKAVVDEIDGLSDDHVAYLNLQTGELVTLSAEEISAADNQPLWYRRGLVSIPCKQLGSDCSQVARREWYLISTWEGLIAVRPDRLSLWAALMFAHSRYRTNKTEILYIG
jgi:hypothetical protein